MFDYTTLQRELVIYGSSSRTAKMIHCGIWNEAIVIVLGNGRVGGCIYQYKSSPQVLSHEISSTSRAPACSSLPAGHSRLPLCLHQAITITITITIAIAIAIAPISSILSSLSSALPCGSKFS